MNYVDHFKQYPDRFQPDDDPGKNIKKRVDMLDDAGLKHHLTINVSQTNVIIDMLKNDKTVQSLTITGSENGESLSIEDLCTMLKVNKTLKKIHLSWNYIRD